MKLSPAPRYIVSSLKNWVNGTGSLSYEQSEYLEFRDDLVATMSYEDASIAVLLPRISKTMIWLYQCLQKVDHSLTLATERL